MGDGGIGPKEKKCARFEDYAWRARAIVREVVHIAPKWIIPDISLGYLICDRSTIGGAVKLGTV